jgi:hypothetical protein
MTATTVHAQESGATVVLPLHTIGVNDTTAAVVGDLLRDELDSRGVSVLPGSRLPPDIPKGVDACAEAACAAVAAANLGASRAVYGSLSRLGSKFIVRIQTIRAGETDPEFTDQLTATYEEDLDAVMRRFADGIVAGRPHSETASVNNITGEETLEPRRRSSRASAGLRAGFLFPVDNSYGGTDRLTAVRVAFKYETEKLLVDTTPVLGFAWRGDTVEWTILDVFVARILGSGDFTPYVGAGMGVHALNIAQVLTLSYDPYYPYDYPSHSQSETTLTADAGIGLMMLRTYDFSLAFDLRYHVVFSDFTNIGGNGAQAVSFMFGVNF